MGGPRRRPAKLSPSIYPTEWLSSKPNVLIDLARTPPALPAAMNSACTGTSRTRPRPRRCPHDPPPPDPQAPRLRWRPPRRADLEADAAGPARPGSRRSGPGRFTSHGGGPRRLSERRPGSGAAPQGDARCRPTLPGDPLARPQLEWWRTEIVLRPESGAFQPPTRAGHSAKASSGVDHSGLDRSFTPAVSLAQSKVRFS